MAKDSSGPVKYSSKTITATMAKPPTDSSSPHQQSVKTRVASSARSSPRMRWTRYVAAAPGGVNRFCVAIDEVLVEDSRLFPL